MVAGLGIALPILAHLLNRFQVQRTDWAAMQFLDRNVRVRSRQIKLRDTTHADKALVGEVAAAAFVGDMVYVAGGGDGGHHGARAGGV